jgi:LytS/YehU family sensor histidine kinase
MAYFAAWLLAAAVLGVAWTWRLGGGLIWALTLLLPVSLATGLAALSLYPICRAFPLRPARWQRAMVRRGAVITMLAAAVTIAAIAWDSLANLWGRDALMPLSPKGWLAVFAVEMTLLSVATVLHDAWIAQSAAQASAAAESEARLLARSMELKALRNQIDPHFLFNSLNAISALIPKEPAAARAMTIDLAGFFRQTLGLADRDRVHLDEELELVEHYLGIEQRRLGDKLRLAMDIAPDCRQAWLPPLVLQPLVENAVKHGIRPLETGGQLEIRAHKDGGRLVLEVANPYIADAPQDRSGLGQGLQLLKSRLDKYYAEAAGVLVDRDTGRYRVEITIPWRT